MLAEFSNILFCDVASRVNRIESRTMNSTDQQSHPYMLKPGEGVAGFDASVKAAKSSTGGSFTLIESHTQGGAPWHVHSREDEYLYVISGALKVSCGKEVFLAEKGSFVFLPRGVAHAWDV